MAAKKIFTTGTMRTGSSLLSNTLSAHSKIMILSDRFHFFRFVYKKYEPLNEMNVRRLLMHQRARLFHRYGVELDVEGILSSVKGEGSHTLSYMTRQ
jgi:hypothetical protein